MKQFDELKVTQVFVPMVNVARITAKHTLGRLPVATIDSPENPCGIARRIGYTGRAVTDLAIYRLKVRLQNQQAVTTLPILFVVDEGKFIEYESWQHEHCDKA